MSWSGIDWREEWKGRLLSRQNGDSSEREEGFCGESGDSEEEGWMELEGLEALACHHFRTVIIRYHSLSFYLCSDHLVVNSNVLGPTRSLLLPMRLVVILITALLH